GGCVVTVCGPEIPLTPKNPRSARSLPQKPQLDPNHAHVATPPGGPQPGQLEAGAPAFAPQAPAATGTPLTSSHTPGTASSSTLYSVRPGPVSAPASAPVR